MTTAFDVIVIVVVVIVAFDVGVDDIHHCPLEFITVQYRL